MGIFLLIVKTLLLGLGLYVRDNLPIAREPSLEDSKESFMCFRLSLLHSTSYLFFLYRSPSPQCCSVIDTVSSSIDNTLLLHPTANIFVFADFNIHHSDWLKYSNGTNSYGIDAYNFSLSQSLTQLVDFPTRFPDRDDQTPSLLDLFLSFSPNVCNASILSPLGNLDHAVINVDISLSSKAAQESPVHRMLYSYHQGDLDSFRDFLCDILGKLSLIFKLKLVLGRLFLGYLLVLMPLFHLVSTKRSLILHLGSLQPALLLLPIGITTFIFFNLLILMRINVYFPLLEISVKGSFKMLSLIMSTKFMTD